MAHSRITIRLWKSHVREPGPTAGAIRRIAGSYRAKCSEHSTIPDSALRDICGDKLDDFLASRESAERYLHHPSWILRWAAIAVLEGIWGCDTDLAAACERLAFEDPDQRVRHLALFTLRRCYSGTNDRRIGALLARTVADADLPSDIRETAYHQLCDLRGVDPLTSPIPGRCRIPEDIDLALVNSFLDDKRHHRSGAIEGL